MDSTKRYEMLAKLVRALKEDNENPRLRCLLCNRTSEKIKAAYNTNAKQLSKVTIVNYEHGILHVSVCKPCFAGKLDSEYNIFALKKKD